MGVGALRFVVTDDERTDAAGDETEAGEVETAAGDEVGDEEGDHHRRVMADEEM